MESILEFVEYIFPVVLLKWIELRISSMHNSCLNFVDNLFGRDRKRLSKEANKGCPIYHEKQVKELCALHALNNLFQDKNAFSKSFLDNICNNLSPDHLVNPHRSLLGLGNYDVNVLMAALQLKGCEAVWFDKRKDPSSIEFCVIRGLILNVPSEMKFLPLRLNRKHWVCVREIEGTYYNLDSKLHSPTAIGKEADLVSYLREQIRGKEREIFVVVDADLERDALWRKDPRRQEVVRPSKSLCSNAYTEAIVHLEDQDSLHGRNYPS